jgi:coenzyme F420-0:L-glutamate ligase/coenzyme F420-1:gamma-L-glutamate ligase
MRPTEDADWRRFAAASGVAGVLLEALRAVATPERLRLAAEPLPGLPEVRAGDDLAAIVAEAAGAAGMELADTDVLVLAQKIVSKAEGRLVPLATVSASARARKLAASLDKDPRFVQLVLDESSEVLRAERGVLIVRTRHGFVCANAGIDRSNVPGDEVASLLPEDPDASARRLRAGLAERLGARPAVVVSDSFGRAWRVGQLDVAIGCAGLAPLDDRRGSADSLGRELSATIDAIADAVASAAALVRSKAGHEAVVVVRGLERQVTGEDGAGAAAILRPRDEDLFS